MVNCLIPYWDAISGVRKVDAFLQPFILGSTNYQKLEYWSGPDGYFILRYNSNPNNCQGQNIINYVLSSTKYKF